jgi:hypothetical protein
MDQEVMMDTGQDLASNIAKRVADGKSILCACEGKIFDALVIDGKTLRDWGKELTIVIPEEPDDIEGLEVAASRLGNAIQKAEGLLGRVEFQCSATTNFFEEMYATEFARLMEEDRHAKRIAADKVRQMVLSKPEIDMALSASQTASAMVDYFKRITKGLEDARRCVEDRRWLINTRARHLRDL